MKFKKSPVLYDPKLIWACSLDLSAIQLVPSDRKKEQKFDKLPFLPTEPKFKKEKPDQAEQN